jgi:uncharacterized protein
MTPPGWYPDPWRQSWYRWWDGRQWTPWLHPPVPAAEGPARAAPTFPSPAVWYILAGSLLSILAATAVGEWLDFRENWHGIAVVYSVLFGSMVLWSQVISRRLGSGDLRADFGLRLRLEDLGWGILTFAAAMAARVVIVIVMPEETTNPMRDLDRALDFDRGVLFAFAVAAVVGAPIVEELVFRGVLQRGLTTLVGAPAAIGLQAIIFAGYHFVPSTGRFTPIYFLALAAFGVAAGIAVHLTGRLGPAMVAHVLNNALAIAVLAAM